MRMKELKAVLTSGEVADLLNVSQMTLQRWDESGRLVPAATTEGGHRRYTAAQIAPMLGLDVGPRLGLGPDEGLGSPAEEGNGDDDDLATDLDLARKLYRADPRGFIARHPATANKILELAHRQANGEGPETLSDLLAQAPRTLGLNQLAVAVLVEIACDEALTEAGFDATRRSVRGVLSLLAPKNVSPEAWVTAQLAGAAEARLKGEALDEPEPVHERYEPEGLD